MSNETEWYEPLLAEDGYASLEEWGRDSDYFEYADGTWDDEDGNPVDLEAAYEAAMEAAERGPWAPEAL